MEVNTQKFVQSSRRAIQDAKLQKAIHKATSRAVDERNKAASQIPDWEELRNKARTIKEQTLERLDEYLNLLADSMTKAGGVVHWAKTADDATSYITELAKSKGVKTVVKGKSMTTEEIAINQRLLEIGVEPVETDLGEYIIQLANETPFHIIAPAIHKTRQDIGQLFSQHLSVDYEEDPEVLTKIARNTLREKFCNAEMGITGVNFAVAETGTIVVIENEGNGRMSTSLPSTYVAVMGIEKVIPRLEDLSVFLSLLPRSGTGQKATGYASFLTGPSRPGENGGPNELHLVILDNGRSRILQDPDMRESLFCIRCGACLNICPIYNKVGGHAYGWVYSGPIGAVITPQLIGVDKAKHLPAASTLCGACRDICPLKINIPHMLLNLRRRISEDDEGKSRQKLRWMERAVWRVWAMSMKSSKTYSLATRTSAFLQRRFVGKLVMGRLPILARWTRHRTMPPLAIKPFRELWKERLSIDGQ